MINKFISDVRSKADEVRQTVTLQAAKARDALRISNFRRSDAFLLEKQLENQASHATTISQLHDMYVRWIALILTADEATTPLYYGMLQSPVFMFPAFPFGNFKADEQLVSPGDLTAKSPWIPPATDVSPKPPPPPPDQEAKDLKNSTQSNRLCCPGGLTFRQAFLRSQAIEVALLSLAQLEHVRGCLTGPLDERGIEASTRGALQRLMSLCMRGDHKIHLELLFLFCSVDLKCESCKVHLRHLAELAALLKLDWETDYMSLQIQKMKSESDRMKCLITEINLKIKFNDLNDEGQTITQARPGTDEFEAAMKEEAMFLMERSGASEKLLHLKRQLEMLEKMLTERKLVVQRNVVKRLSTLMISADSLAHTFTELTLQAADKGKSVTQESIAMENEIDQKIIETRKSKAEVDLKIQNLNEKKTDLLNQIQVLNKHIAEATQDQVKVMASLDSLISSKGILKRNFDQKIDQAKELKRLSDLYQLDMQNMKSLVKQVQTTITDEEPMNASDVSIINESSNDEELDQIEAQSSSNQAAFEIPLLIVSHLKDQTIQLQHEKNRLFISFDILQHLWSIKLEKDQELQTRLQLYEEFQDYSSDDQGEVVESSLDVNSQKEQLRARVEATAGALEIVHVGISEAQKKTSQLMKTLEIIWATIKEFVRNEDLEKLISPKNAEDQQDVDVGTENNSEDGTVQTAEDIKTLVLTSQNNYTTAKKLIESKHHLLLDSHTTNTAINDNNN